MQNLTPMEWLLIGLVIAVLAAGLIVGLSYQKRTRTERLRRRFGPEYDDTVLEYGNRSRAESELDRRDERLRKLPIRELTLEERNHYVARWTLIQRRFIDEPGAALLEADNLVTEVMSLRGYPTSNLNERYDDVSGAYPLLARKYREACAIAALERRNETTTEERRRGVVLYRDLFDELIGEERRDEALRRVS